MTIVRSRVSPSLIAAVLLLPFLPVEAAGQTETRRNPVEVTFTKWRTAIVPPSGVPSPGNTTRFLFKGYVGGDLGVGEFVGELLDRTVSTACTAVDPPCTPGVSSPTISPAIVALQAIYEVHAGDHSFTALINGGSNGATGAAVLDGVVVAGWRTGSPVRVTFATLNNCADAPAGVCFQGVIRVERAP